VAGAWQGDDGTNEMAHAGARRSSQATLCGIACGGPPADSQVVIATEKRRHDGRFDSQAVIATSEQRLDGCCDGPIVTTTANGYPTGRPMVVMTTSVSAIRQDRERLDT
jgi:hypothetical protein